jgi:hypothetical protein
MWSPPHLFFSWRLIFTSAQNWADVHAGGFAVAEALLEAGVKQTLYCANEM